MLMSHGRTTSVHRLKLLYNMAKTGLSFYRYCGMKILLRFLKNFNIEMCRIRVTILLNVSPALSSADSPVTEVCAAIQASWYDVDFRR